MDLCPDEDLAFAWFPADDLEGHGHTRQSLSSPVAWVFQAPVADTQQVGMIIHGISIEIRVVLSPSMLVAFESDGLAIGLGAVVLMVRIIACGHEPFPATWAFPGSDCLDVTVLVANVDLFWPTVHGAPPLRGAETTVESVGLKEEC